MALDEFLFGRVMRFLKNRRERTDENDTVAQLESLKPRLTILARALTGKPVTLYPSIREGGYKGNSFFLPEKCSNYDSFELNVSFYLFRVLYLSVQQQSELNWYSEEPLPEELALLKARQHAADVLDQLFEDFPPSRMLHEQLLSGCAAGRTKTIVENWLYGKWMVDSRTELKPDVIADLPANVVQPPPKTARKPL